MVLLQTLLSSLLIEELFCRRLSLRQGSVAAQVKFGLKNCVGFVGLVPLAKHNRMSSIDDHIERKATDEKSTLVSCCSRVVGDGRGDAPDDRHRPPQMPVPHD